jgi:hypothetical protein
MQSVDFVCPHLDLHLAPLQMNVRMMPLFLSKLTNLVREVKRVAKVLEYVDTFKMMLVHYLPDSIVKLCEIVRILVLGERFVLGGACLTVLLFQCRCHIQGYDRLLLVCSPLGRALRTLFCQRNR